MTKTTRLSYFHRIALALFVCVGLASVTVGGALASTFYISTSGNDSNAGTATSPWRTLQHAIQTIRPGDVVHVANGRYAGMLVTNHVATAASPTQFLADGAAVMIDRPGPSSNDHFFEVQFAENIRFSGFIIDSANYVLAPGKRGILLFQSSTRNIEWNNCQFLNGHNNAILAPRSPGTKLIGCTFRNNSRTLKDHTIYFGQSQNPYAQRNIEIRNCVIYANAENPVQFHPRTADPPSATNDNEAKDCIIDSNVFYGDIGPFLMLFACSNFTITNNLFYNCQSSHIIRFMESANGPTHWGPASNNNTVANNIMINPNSSGLNFQGDASGNIVFNNVLMGSSGGMSGNIGGQFIDGGSNIVSGWNDQLLRDLFVNVQGRGAGNDIVLVDARLKSGSAAIDDGRASYMGKNAPTVDLDGAFRDVTPDIGAYEFDAVGNPQPPLPPTNVRLSQSAPGCALIQWNPASGPDIQGYVVYYDSLSVAQGQTAQYRYSRDVGNVSSWTQCGLSSRRWYAALRSRNSSSEFSAFSAEASVVLDSAAPLLVGRDPSSGAVDVPIDAKVYFTLQDNLTGVDTNSVSVRIGGILPRRTSFFGNPASYAVVCYPNGSLPPRSLVTVAVTASDRAQAPNTLSSSWSFTTADTTSTAQDVTPPAISGQNPGGGDMDVPLNTNIFFVVSDTESGVDTNSVSVLIGGLQPTRTSFFGVPSTYAVVCETGRMLPANSTIGVSVTARDLSSSPNSRTVSWSFATEDTVAPAPDLNPPVLSGASPGDGAVDVSRDTDVIFVLSDERSGVDTASVSVLINGAPPAKRSFFGIPSSYMVVCELADTLPSNLLVNVVVSARDRASPPNSMSRNWRFTTREADDPGDNSPPTFSNLVPASNARGVDQSAHIRATVTDDTGLNPATIVFRYNGVVVPVSVTVTDTLFRSAVVEFDNGAGFALGSVVDVVVSACDQSANCATLGYAFTVVGAGDDPGLQASVAQIVPDGYWVDDPSRPLEVQDLPTGWTVRIFNTAGAEVKTFRNTGQTGVDWTWDFANDYGRRVARSLYLIRVIDNTGVLRQSGRFVVQSD